MSALHTSRAPWLMLSLFTAAALLFFVLAAGQDVGLLPEVLQPDAQTTVMGNIRRALMRVEQKAVTAEDDMRMRAGQVMEHAGQRLEGPGGGPAATLSQPAQPAPSLAPAENVSQDPELKAPGKLLGHTFRLTEQGFKATFLTDRAVPEPKAFFFSGPAMWVVDLPGNWRNASTRVSAIEHGFISQLVIGEHQDHLRLSFHFREANQLHPAESPVIIRGVNGFTVIVPPADL
ncbi:MAG: hypothetical protein V1782_00475 [Pseudomonadota bacterium]